MQESEEFIDQLTLDYMNGKLSLHEALLKCYAEGFDRARIQGGEDERKN